MRASILVAVLLQLFAIAAHGQAQPAAPAATDPAAAMAAGADAAATATGDAAAAAAGATTGVMPATDPATGLPVAPAMDPLTGQPIAPAIDPLTGQPVAPVADPMAAQPAIDPVTGLPIDPTAAPTATVAPPAPPAPEHAVVDNPYGLAALWAQGDFVAKGTLIILVIMSFATWYIMLTKLVYQQRIFMQATAARSIWNAPSLEEGAAALKTTNVFREVIEDGLRAASHHDGKLTDRIDLHEWVTMSLQRSVDSVGSRLGTGLSFLASVGSTAPFVGLFGTVWGIYHALIAIGIAGQASIDKVAGPVGEALIMTAIGLAVAVPAVLGYNWLVRRNKSAMELLRNFSADVHALLLTGGRPKKAA